MEKYTSPAADMECLVAMWLNGNSRLVLRLIVMLVSYVTEELSQVVPQAVTEIKFSPTEKCSTRRVLPLETC